MQKEKSPDSFWREYEEKTGEKILARGMGRYLSGWDEFDSRGWKAIWGLIIATSGGFRFHHFAQYGWLDLFARRDEAPREKTIFIPGEKIVSADLRRETLWWKKLLKPSPPRLSIRYTGAEGKEKELLLESDNISGDFAEKLSASG